MATYKERQAKVYAEYGTTNKIPFQLKYYARYDGDKPPVPTITKNRASSTSTNPFRPFSIGNPLQKWRDSAISESVGMMQPLNRENMEKHDKAVKHINKMNALKLGTMSSKDVAFVAHKMVENRARASTMRKGGGKKKSRKSRKTRRNPIHK